MRVSSDVKNASGYIGVASEMVGCDDRFREIVDYLLCRVIIAEDMDRAVRLSKMNIGGFRIVTRDGEVINAFGAITGGRYKNKTANLLDRKKEISALKAKITEYNEKTAKLKELKEKLETARTQLRAERDKLRAAITELDIEGNVLRADREHAESLVKEDEGAAERFRSNMETLASDIERADAMIEGHRQKIREAEQEYADAESRAEALMKDSEDIRPVIEEDNEKIVALKVKIGERESRMLADNEMIERVRDAVTELEASVEDNLALQESLAADREQLTTSGEKSGDMERALSEEKAALEAKIAEISAKLEEGRSKSEALMLAQKNDREDLEKVRDERYKLEVRTARNETLLDTQKDKLWDEFEVSYAEALDMRDENFAITAGNRESREIRLRLAELGDVNVGAIEEYKAVSKRYEFMTSQEADLTKAMTELNEIISNMDRTIRNRFKENFDRVVVNFEQSFKELFGGGYAELRLEDESKPLESGIEITAQPPGKKLKNINLLSGGEKTLTAIALMFAVLKAKPTPFVILDEVEAALDEVNIERFSDYLKNFENIQFALITHQKATMEHADVLYGVTMPEQGISRMLSLKLGDEFDPEGLE
jgi:chromosome segregation protein